MSQLSITVPFHDGETVVSFASRLAAANFVGLREFCQDVGLDRQRIIDGDGEEIERLCALAGLAPIPRSQVCERDGRFHWINGELLSKASFLRNRLRYCPHCLREDIARGNGAKRARPFARLIWGVTYIRTCSRHEVLLRTADSSELDGSHDIAAMISAEMAKADFNETPTQCATTSFENYIVRRISGEKENFGFWDELPLYAFGRMCELVGATIVCGKRFIAEEIDDLTWSTCGEEGFSLIKQGEGAFRRFLEDLHSDFWEKTGDVAGRLAYGRLYERLAHETDDPVYDCVRALIRDVALSCLPIGPGYEMFGPVNERRVHSIQSASAEFEVHPRTLRKLLIASGEVSEAAAENTNARILVDSNKVADLVAKFNARLTWNEARLHLNTTRTFWNVLSREGYVSPALKVENSGIGVNPFYLASDLDAFMTLLTPRTTRPLSKRLGVAPMASTIKQANCKFNELINLLLDQKIENVFVDPTTNGLDAFWFDVAEVKQLTKLPNHGGLSLAEAETRLALNWRVLLKLIEHGFLPVEIAVNPVNRCPQKIIRPQAIDGFEAAYVSLFNYARERGRHFLKLRKELEELGITPAITKDLVGASFYKRTDLRT